MEVEHNAPSSCNIKEALTGHLIFNVWANCQDQELGHSAVISVFISKRLSVLNSMLVQNVYSWI